MNEIDYMIDAMAADLIALLMERKGWDMDKACDVLYNTDTFAKLSDSKNGVVLPKSFICLFLSR